MRPHTHTARRANSLPLVRTFRAVAAAAMSSDGDGASSSTRSSDDVFEGGVGGGGGDAQQMAAASAAAAAAAHAHAVARLRGSLFTWVCHNCTLSQRVRLPKPPAEGAAPQDAALDAAMDAFADAAHTRLRASSAMFQARAAHNAAVARWHAQRTAWEAAATAAAAGGGSVDVDVDVDLGMGMGMEIGRAHV